MASLTQWTWVWVGSGSWWWTGRPGVLWFMGVAKSRTWLSNWTEMNFATKILEATQHCQKKKKDLVCSECVHGVFPRPHSLNQFMPPLCLEENLPVINGNRWFSYLLVNSFANWPIFWDSQGHNLAVSHLSTSSDFSVTKLCFKPGCPDRKPEKGNTPSCCCVLYGSVEATLVQQLLATSFSLWCSFILNLVGVFPENKPGQMNLIVSFLGMLYMCNTRGPPVSGAVCSVFPAHLAALAQ